MAQENWHPDYFKLIISQIRTGSDAAGHEYMRFIGKVRRNIDFRTNLLALPCAIAGGVNFDLKKFQGGLIAGNNNTMHEAAPIGTEYPFDVTIKDSGLHDFFVPDRDYRANLTLVRTSGGYPYSNTFQQIVHVPPKGAPELVHYFNESGQPIAAPSPQPDPVPTPDPSPNPSPEPSFWEKYGVLVAAIAAIVVMALFALGALTL